MFTKSIVEIKVYNSIDRSLVEYQSDREGWPNDLNKNSEQVLEYAKFYNCHGDMVQ